MDRRLLFPAVAITAWAQQPTPAAVEAEAAVRARAEQFFQFQVDKKFRQAEALVAEDSKDEYYGSNKYNIKGFTIEKVELLDGDSRSLVTIKARVTVIVAGSGPVSFDAPSISRWKLEDGAWVWYADQTAAKQTPFGPVRPGQNNVKSPILGMAGKAPDISTLQGLVKIDRDSVALTSETPMQTVTVTNDLPGGVDLELGSNQIAGVSFELEKKHLEAGQNTSIRFRATGSTQQTGIVRLLVSPIAAQLEIRVKVN